MLPLVSNHHHHNFSLSPSLANLFHSMYVCIPSDPQGINYIITPQDIVEFEQTHQVILSPGSIVLFYTGWSSYWQQGAKQYLGS